MTVEGVDFSSGRPGGAALVAAGKHFVCRYVPYGGYAKGLTPAEVADYHAHDLGIVLVWEQVASRALQGFSAGVADAMTSQTAAAALGFPTDRPIYFGVDFDTNSGEWPELEAYFGGVISVLRLARTGVYGEAAICAHLAAMDLASWFWQTLAWSGGTMFPGAHLYQYRNGQTINGAAVDYDRALKADFGQWPRPTGGIPTMASFNLLPGARTGTLTIKADAPHSFLRLADGTLHAAPVTMGVKQAWGPVQLLVPIPGGVAGADRSTVYVIGKEAAAMLATDVDFTPDTADCAAAVAPLAAQITELEAAAAGEPDRTAAAVAADRAKAHVGVVYD